MMKPIVLLVLAIIAIAPFSTGNAAPKEIQGNKLLLRTAKFQAYKTTKLAALDFIIKVLSTVSKNFESIKNGDDTYEELDTSRLALSFFSTILSAARKDVFDPNDELGQTIFNVFNSILSAFAKDNENKHGNAQFSSGKVDDIVFAKYNGGAIAGHVRG